MAVIPSVGSGLDVLSTRWADIVNTNSEVPIFILSAGWRSGSTLLQRLLMKECLVWGEPFGHACPISQMAETLACITRQWPQPNWFPNGRKPEELSRQFIANLYPPMQSLLEAHLAWFHTLFREPARQAGYVRWGLKEVRLTVDHARYLKWLFPKAKFLFLYRNPYDAWRSYAARQQQGWQWYFKWPDQPLNVRLFAKHWNILAKGFVDHHRDVEGLLVRYEDLKERNYTEIEDYLDLSLDREAAEVRPRDGPLPVSSIGPSDLHVLHTELGPTASKLGYACRIKTREGETTTAQFRVNDRSRCIVLVSVISGVSPLCETGLKELERRGYTVRRVCGDTDSDRSRNQMVSDALLQEFDETMWIDSNIGFHPDDVEKLRSHNLPIACGIYPQTRKQAFACHVMPGTKQLPFGKEGGLHEIMYAHSGFLHVRREVYETIKHQQAMPTCNQRFQRPMTPFFQPMIRDDGEGSWYLTEDFAFCQRAREAGFKIMADTTIRLWRVGTYAYSWEDADLETKRFASLRFNLTGDRDWDAETAEITHPVDDYGAEST